MLAIWYDEYERKEDANVASVKEEDDAMEGDGGDEMKSSKVVKGLGSDWCCPCCSLQYFDGFFSLETC